MLTPVSIDNQGISLDTFLDIVLNRRNLELSQDQAYRERLQKGCDFLKSLYEKDEVVYGVTTGYGESCSVSVKGNEVGQLPKMLARFHGCGMGQDYSPLQCRAILLSRLTSLAQGYSAIRPEVLNRLVDFLNHDVLPRIPQEGSVGASGDLTPLSYIAACVMGERQLFDEGQLKTTEQVYRSKK
jgi:histidine ammonia-lyase